MGTQLEGLKISRHSVAPRALIADDQPDVVEALRLLLAQDGYQIDAVSSPAAALEVLVAQQFDLLLMDLNYSRDTTSGREGLDLLARIRDLDSTLPVVVLTAWGSIDLAVEGMRRGAGDFVLKPWENTRLLETLRAQIEQGQARRRAQRLEAERKVLTSEILEAGEVQKSFLPKELPRLQGFEISSAWKPARVVGGDYFDVLELGGSKVALCIADVMGRGMPAALLMSNLQAAIKSAASETAQPKEVCAKVNRLICNNTAAGKFVTLCYCLLDTAGKRLVYTNAGHNAPVLVPRDGAHLRLQEEGAALGAFPAWNYEQGEVRLASGDRLVFFTDGVSEAVNSKGEEFGEERLIELVRESRELGAGELREKILDAVTEFGGGPFEDDATLMVMAVA